MKHKRLRRKELKKAAFSKAGLVAFIVIFAGIGGYLLLYSHAATTVLLTSPASGADISGNVTLSAICSGCQSVQFEVDGDTVATDATEPFSVTWDSTQFTDGSHNITAVPTDSSGSHGGPSSAVAVTINNNAAAQTANLWIDTDGGACSRNPTPAVYNDASACPWTIATVLAAVQAGDTVIFKSGTYITDPGSSDSMNFNGGKAGVTIKGERGVKPVLNSTAVEFLKATDLTISHLKFLGTASSQGGVTLRQGSGNSLSDVEVQNGHISVVGEASPTISNFFIHDSKPDTSPRGSFQGGIYVVLYNLTPAVYTTDLTVQNGTIMDQAGDGIFLSGTQGASIQNVTERRLWPWGTGDHTDAFQMINDQDVTILNLDARYTWEGILITNSVPVDGSDADSIALTVENSIVLTHGNPSAVAGVDPDTIGNYGFNGPPGRNSLIVNNLFGSLDDPNQYGASVKWDGSFGNSDSTNAVFENNIIQGRIAMESQFLTSAHADYNLYSYANSSCASCQPHDHYNNDTLWTFTGDYELPSSSPAIDTANSTYAPSTDMLDRQRAGPADIGPLEYIPAADVWVSTTGDDSTCVRGDSSKPCATFNKAYSIAQCGDAVEVAAGTYTDQPAFTDVTALDNCSSPVTFKPASGASVTLACSGAPCDGFVSGAVNSSSGGASWFTLDGFTIQGNIWLAGGDHVTITNSDIGGLNTRGSTNVLVSNTDMGPCESPNKPGRTSKCDALPLTSDGDIDSVTLDNDVIHDYSIGGSDHGECIHLFGMSAFTIENSKIYNCQIYGVALEMGSSSCTGGCYIQNNWFGAATTNAIDFEGQPNTNVVIRYNSFNSGAVDMDNSSNTITNTRVIGNIFSNAAVCLTGITYRYNVWQSGTCGTDDTTEASLPYVNASNTSSMDYHLANNTNPAIGLVPNGGTDYNLTVDKDGNTRTFPTDAGANLYTTGGGGGGTDTTPPSVPTNTVKTGSTTTSISISWTASTDEVGVAGYRLYKDGTAVTTTTSTNYTFTNLTCGTSYTVGLTAYDAAGNESDLAADQGTMSTSVCPTTPGDLNKDGHVNILDLSMLLSHWQSTDTTADINASGKVDILDLSILLSHYGT